MMERIGGFGLCWLVFGTMMRDLQELRNGLMIDEWRRELGWYCECECDLSSALSVTRAVMVGSSWWFCRLSLYMNV